MEIRVIDIGEQQGYFDLYGRWCGPELVMDDRGRAKGKFRSGPEIKPASITLGSLSDFKAICSNAIVPSPLPGS